MGTHELEPYLERPNLHMLPISLVKLEMKSVTDEELVESTTSC
jgi:hypothetical protein